MQKTLSLIKQGESQTAEFKTSFQKEVIESVVAFANTKGGHIFVGIKDSGEIVGVQISQESIQNYINIIKQTTEPKIIVDIELLYLEDKQILDIQVDEYPIKPVSYKGRYFKRRNNSNHQMTPIEISNMHLKTINSSWDYFVDLNHCEDDIDELNIEYFKKLANLDDDIESIYKKFELKKDNNITNGCYLLFNNNDKSLFTNIEIGRFQTEILIKDSLSLHGPIIKQVDIVMEFIYKHINKAYVITGKPQRDEVWDYPMEAIREIVVNMIVHRDYTSNVHSIIKIFDDRIEFYNQGKLPEDISIEDVKTGKYKSIPRNLQIADMFKTADIIEKYGSGIKRVLKLFNEYGSKEPLFEERLGGMVVVVYKKDPFALNEPLNEPLSEPLSEPLKQILHIINTNPHITKEQLAKNLNISRATVTRRLKQLKEKNILKRIGSDKSGHWEILGDK